MAGNSTTIADPSGAREPKTFAFDHSYWSHDGFTTGPDGVMVATNPAYATQQQVFTDLGQGVVSNAFEGYNAALFAYGQTGAGKSYSMLGYGANVGIVPIACEEIFRRIQANTDKTREFQVTYSMLEIYNEKVRDLLSPENPPGGLKLRESAANGFFVHGVREVPVSSFEAVARLVHQGNMTRTTASTKMNETSSRSHMVITVRFKQVFMNKIGQSTTKTSDINLVDLAGSERAESTGATGDRLKEGSAINQSLSALGKVISELASQASGKKTAHIPYRDSVLTKLLQNALGGNSRTIMIAALSPAAINYEETLGTLRYADQAKKIQNKAQINESLSDKLIRELKEENQRLQAGGVGAKPGLTHCDLLQAMLQAGKHSDTMDADLMRSAIAHNQQEMAEMGVSWDERLRAAKAEWASASTESSTAAQLKSHCFLQNVNEDPQLSGVIQHVLTIGKTLVGQTKGAAHATVPEGFVQFIPLGGLSVQPQHAVFNRVDDKVTLTLIGAAHILVNGQLLLMERDLVHLDRIALAPNHIYVFVGVPGERSSADQFPDFARVQEEMAASHGFASLVGGSADDQSPEMRKIREDLIAMLPMVAEANAMSQELDKGIQFDLFVMSGASHDLNDKEKKVMVKVVCTKTGWVWTWSQGKFVNRKYLMQELYEQWMEGHALESDKTKDPFWDPAEDFFLGSVYVYLQSLAYTVDVEETLSITNYQGVEEGMLQVAICPCDQHGQQLSEDMFSTPAKLLNSRIDFVIKIPYARGVRWVSEDSTRGVVCKYKFYTDSKKRASKSIAGTINPEFEYAKQFTMRNVSQSFLDYLETDALVVEVWGIQGTGRALHAGTVRSERRATLHRLSNFEASMEKVLAEADLLEERGRMQRHIKELQAEIEMLRIEKDSFEKEMTRITLHSDPSFVRGATALAAEDAVIIAGVTRFLGLNAALRTKVARLASTPGPVPKEDIRSLKDGCDDHQKELTKIQTQLNNMVATLRANAVQLSKRK